MAKTVELSKDNGTTYHKLPGASGSFQAEAEEISDTIFGHTFQSNEIGLISWTMSANAYFKGYAGYHAEIKSVSGAATVMTKEACTQEGATKIYAITDATKTIWDRSKTISVFDGSTKVGASKIEWIDYLFGRIKFIKTFAATGNISVTGHYYSTATLGKGNSYTLTMTGETIDNSDFKTVQSNDGHRTFITGLRTVSLEVGGIFDVDKNHKDDLTERKELIVEIDPAGDGKSIARGFFRATSVSQSGDVGALEDETINLSLTVPTNTKLYIPFSWKHASDTLLSESVKIAIDAFLTEATDTQVRYLPTGVLGAAPKEGIEGNIVFTDISLSGGLSDMNTFSCEMQGTGKYTEV